MHLRRIEVVNFGPFRRATWVLPRTGLVLLAGANNAGKSSLLAALEAISVTQPVSARVHARSTEPAEILATFELSDNEWAHVESQDPTGAVRATRARIPVDELQLAYQSHTLSGETKMYPHRLGLAAREDIVVLAEHCWDDNSNAGTVKWRKLAGDGELGEMEGRGGGTNAWAAMASLYNEFAAWKVPFEGWRATFFSFAAHRVGTDRERKIKADERLLSDGANLPEALLHLYTNDPAAFERVRSVITDVVPDAGELRIGTSNELVWASFHDPAIEVTQNLKDLGTGVEQLALTAFAGERSEAGAIVVVEEPESHLHAGAQRRLLRHLRRWSASHLIIATTHSTVFLDRSSDATSSVWLVTRTDGESALEELAGDRQEVIEAIGVRIGDLLLSSKVLVVEGPTDEAILAKWFGPLLRSTDTEVVASTVGGAGARWAPILDSWLHAPPAVARRIRFLRDRDELTSAEVAKLADMTGVLVLARREIENYLLEPSSVLAYMASLDEMATAPITVEDLEIAWRERADALRPLLIAKRVVAEVLQQWSVVRSQARELVAGLERPDADSLIAALQSVVEVPPDAEFNVRSAWNAHAADLDHSWEANWRSLAPGAELLEAALGLIGRRYRKVRDAARLAEFHEAPEDLRTALLELLVD